MKEVAEAIQKILDESGLDMRSQYRVIANLKDEVARKIETEECQDIIDNWHKG